MSCSVGRIPTQPRNTLNGLFGKKWFSIWICNYLTGLGATILDIAGTERPFMLNSCGLTYTNEDTIYIPASNDYQLMTAEGKLGKNAFRN